MPTLIKDGVRVTTEVPRELVTLRSQGFKEEPAAEETLTKLTVKDLRRELSDRGLPVAGKKEELVARLAEQPLPTVASTVDSSSAPTESTSPTDEAVTATASADQ